MTVLATCMLNRLKLFRMLIPIALLLIGSLYWCFMKEGINVNETEGSHTLRYKSWDHYISNRNRITKRPQTQTCRQDRPEFWDTVLVKNWTFTDMTCIDKDESQHTVVSYFLPQNFENITCPEKVIRFAKIEIPQVALTSFPGSGNTWIRHVIESISGIATGSIYCDGKLRHTFIGECSTIKHNNRTIAVKTHRRAAKINSKNPFDKAVLILRNPFHALMADFNRRQPRSGHTRVAERKAFETKDWDKFVRSQSHRWRKFVLSWVENFDRPVHIVLYENLLHNFIEESFELAEFLGVNVTFRDLWCAAINREGEYHRQKPEWMTPDQLFSSELKEVVQMDINLVSDALIETSFAKRKERFWVQRRAEKPLAGPSL